VPVIDRTRTLRTGSRLASSPYKVDTKAVSYADTLRLTIFIDGGRKRKLGEVEFRGSDLARKDSFHFRVESDKAKWRVSFIGAQPITIVLQ
jgi:hypothetical protein